MAVSTVPTTQVCVAHRGHRAVLAEPGLLVCHRCLTRLADALADLPRLWDQLLDLATTGRTGSGGRAGLNSAAPVRLDVLAVIDPHSGPDPELTPAAGIISDWAALVADLRRFAPVLSISDRIDVLTRNAAWLAAQPDLAAEFARDVAAVHHTMRRLCGETAVVIATCQQPHPDPGVAGECGGALIHDPSSDSYPVRCVDCGDRWSRGSCELALSQLDQQDWLRDRA